MGGKRPSTIASAIKIRLRRRRRSHACRRVTRDGRIISDASSASTLTTPRPAPSLVRASCLRVTILEGDEDACAGRSDTFAFSAAGAERSFDGSTMCASSRNFASNWRQLQRSTPTCYLEQTSCSTTSSAVMDSRRCAGRRVNLRLRQVVARHVFSRRTSLISERELVKLLILSVYVKIAHGCIGVQRTCICAS